MGLLGFAVHDANEPRISDALRTWGPAHEGLALSVFAAPSDDKSQPPDLSIALKNLGTEDRVLLLTDWMGFYTVEMDATPNQYAELSRKQALAKAKNKVTIKAGKFVETDLPLSLLYQLQRRRTYTARVRCELGLISNEVEIGL